MRKEECIIYEVGQLHPGAGGLRLSGICHWSPGSQHVALSGLYGFSLNLGCVYVVLGWAAACSPLCSDIECHVRLDSPEHKTLGPDNQRAIGIVYHVSRIRLKFFWNRVKKKLTSLLACSWAFPSVQGGDWRFFPVALIVLPGAVVNHYFDKFFSCVKTCYIHNWIKHFHCYDLVVKLQRSHFLSGVQNWQDMVVWLAVGPQQLSQASSVTLRVRRFLTHVSNPPFWAGSILNTLF